MTMEPLISLCLVGPRRSYAAGDELVAEYQLDAVLADEVQAVEASVLWHTEGKGEEDMGVHFFERLPGDAEDGDLRPLQRFRTTLPSSPLSYSGAIFTIRWSVRVCGFFPPRARVSARAALHTRLRPRRRAERRRSATA